MYGADGAEWYVLMWRRGVGSYVTLSCITLSLSVCVRVCVCVCVRACVCACVRVSVCVSSGEVAII